MTWSGHWHGYGPWIGSRDAYGADALRRPGAFPGDEETRTFLAQAVPPLQLGHWLMRRGQAAADRTWTASSDAVAWLRTTYTENPPAERDDGRRAYPDLGTKVRCAQDALPRGVDASWVHYTRTQNLVSFQVVCCPHRFHPHIPCPLPPR